MLRTPSFEGGSQSFDSDVYARLRPDRSIQSSVQMGKTGYTDHDPKLRNKQINKQPHLSLAAGGFGLGTTVVAELLLFSFLAGACQDLGTRDGV